MLDEALRVFAQRGYHGASMADIAAGAGVTKPMVYAYFGSKDDLYLRCIDRAIERLMGAFDISPEEGETLEETMWRRVLAYFRFVGEHRDHWLLVQRQAVASGGPFSERVAEARRRVVGLVVGQLAEAAGPGTPRGELEPLAAGIVGAGEALGDWWVEHPQESAEAMAQREMDLIWTGLGGLMRGERWTAPAVGSRA
jgi:AcrR family transcriptional regulator